MRPWTTHPDECDPALPRLDRMVEGMIIIMTLCIVLLVCCSCGTTRQVTVVDRITHDTLYINKVQYDSIYVSQDLFTDRSKDTILIRQHDVEYRYKMIRDTIERVKIEVVHDSIPYEVRIKERIEVEKPMSAFCIICIVWFFVSIILLVWWFYLKIKY